MNYITLIFSICGTDNIIRKHYQNNAQTECGMKQIALYVSLVLSGIVLAIVFGIMLVLRKIAIYRMNHTKSAWV